VARPAAELLGERRARTQDPEPRDILHTLEYRLVASEAPIAVAAAQLREARASLAYVFTETNYQRAELAEAKLERRIRTALAT
jgi:hypothetical protein